MTYFRRSGTGQQLTQQEQKEAHVRFVTLTLAVLAAGVALYLWPVWRFQLDGLPWMAFAVLLVAIITGGVALARYAEKEVERGQGIWFGVGVLVILAGVAAGAALLKAAWLPGWLAPLILAAGLISLAAGLTGLALLADERRLYLGDAADKGSWRVVWVLAAAALISMIGLALASPLRTLVLKPHDMPDNLKEQVLGLFSWLGIMPVAGFTMTLALMYPTAKQADAAKRALRVLCGFSFALFWATLWGAAHKGLWTDEYVALLGIHLILFHVGLPAVSRTVEKVVYALEGVGAAGTAEWLFLKWPAADPTLSPAMRQLLLDIRLLIPPLLVTVAGAAVLSIISRKAAPAPVGKREEPIRPYPGEENWQETSAPGLPRKRVAYVVVHGMAQQQRHETLDAFASGFLYKAGQEAPEHRVRLSTLTKEHGDEYREDAVGYRLRLSNNRVADAYEIYWAPLAQGAQTWGSTLRWVGVVLATALGGIIRFGADHRDEKTRKDVMRKQWAMSAYLTAAAGGVGMLGAVLWIWWGQFDGATRAVVRDLINTNALTLQLFQNTSWKFLVALLLLGFFIWAVMNLLTHSLSAIGAVRQLISPRPADKLSLAPDGPRSPSELILRLGTAVIWAVWVGAGYRVAQFFADTYKEMTFHGNTIQSGALLSLTIWLAVVITLLAKVRDFLADTFGDVPTYTTLDEFSKPFQARSAIQEKAFRILITALTEYDRVILVGHSLGSVVTRDLVRDVWLHRPDLFERLHALITIGSPLRKIQAMLERQGARPYGKSPLDASYSGEIYGEPEGWKLESAQPVTASVVSEPPPPPLPWYNFWIMTDLFADPLRDKFPVTYEAQVNWGLRGVIWSHSDYWHVSNFYEELENLLQPVAQQPPKKQAM